MAGNASIQLYPADRICALCAEESRKFRDNASTADEFCMEAFRRAVVEGDELCWQSLQDVYRVQVVAWCRSAAAGITVANEDLVAFVWEKFWQNYKPAKFAQAQSVSQILSYLKSCALSAVYDEKRELGSVASLDAPVASRDGGTSTLGDVLPDPAEGPEAVIEGKLSRAELRALVAAELKDDKERLIIADKFDLGLTSREIFALHRDIFPDVNDVYRVTRNLLERLARRLKDWAEEGEA